MLGKMAHIKRLARAAFDELKAKSEQPARPTPDDSSPVLIVTRDEFVTAIAYHFGRAPEIEGGYK
jgi:hypothetical protein